MGGDDFDCDVESCLDNCGAHFDRYEMAEFKDWSSSSDSSSSSGSSSGSSSSGSSSYDIDFEGDYERYQVDDQELMGADGHDEAYYEQLEKEGIEDAKDEGEEAVDMMA